MTGGRQVVKRSNLEVDAPVSLRALATRERRQAAAAIMCARRVTGRTVHWARKSLGLKQTELAALLRVAAETLSRWENGNPPMPRHFQLALVAILDGVDKMDGDVEAFVREELKKS